MKRTEKRFRLKFKDGYEYTTYNEAQMSKELSDINNEDFEKGLIEITVYEENNKDTYTQEFKHKDDFTRGMNREYENVEKDQTFVHSGHEEWNEEELKQELFKVNESGPLIAKEGYNDEENDKEYNKLFEQDDQDKVYNPYLDRKRNI